MCIISSTTKLDIVTPEGYPYILFTRAKNEFFLAFSRRQAAKIANGSYFDTVKYGDLYDMAGGDHQVLRRFLSKFSTNWRIRSSMIFFDGDLTRNARPRTATAYEEARI